MNVAATRTGSSHRPCEIRAPVAEAPSDVRRLGQAKSWIVMTLRRDGRNKWESVQARKTFRSEFIRQSGDVEPDDCQRQPTVGRIAACAALFEVHVERLG